MERGILFISPHRNDALLLGRMLGQGSLALDHVSNLAEASGRLRRRRYGAVLTEAQLPDGGWKDVLDLTDHMPSSPALVVTDRLADERFWAEVLNLGAYDLLAQPFDAGEVQRILEHACYQGDRYSAPVKTRTMKRAC